MFTNIEKKIKVIAKVDLGVSFILAAFCLVAAQVLIAVSIVLAGFISAWVTYAFAEILESTKEMNRTLKFALQENVNKTIIENSKNEAEREKRENELKQMKALAMEEKKKAEIEARRKKEERIALYWSEHQDEYDALLSKKQEAEAKLKKVSNIAGNERKTIQDLISAIDSELSKDR